jgi:hypothetical protein
MDEQIMVRKTSEDDGEKIRWSLVVGSEPVVAIRTADTLPKEKADGLVQVAGTGLAAGQRVVVPEL